MPKTPEHRLIYAVWREMIKRCHDTEHADYYLYGARGIRVCARWRSSVELFSLDMGIRPTGYCIDRINNDGPYNSRNCRWVSQAENSRNKRNNILITHNGITKTLTDWARHFSYDVSNLHKYWKRGGEAAVILKLQSLKLYGRNW